MSEFPPQQGNQNKQPRPFRLDEILSIVSGINFLDNRGDPDPNAFTRRIGDALSAMTGEGQLETHQLPRISEEVTEALLNQHPQLRDMLAGLPAEPGPDATDAQYDAHEQAAKAWHDSVAQQYGDKMGDTWDVAPLDPGAHTHIDAGAEFQMMGGNTIDTPVKSPEHLNQLMGDYTQAKETRDRAREQQPAPATAGFDWQAAETQFAAPAAETRPAPAPRILAVAPPLGHEAFAGIGGVNFGDDRAIYSAAGVSSANYIAGSANFAPPAPQGPIGPGPGAGPVGY